MLESEEKCEAPFKQLEFEGVGYVKYFGVPTPPLSKHWEVPRAFVIFL